MEPHGFTAVVPVVSSAKPAEVCPPSPRLRRTPAAHFSTASSTLRSSLLQGTSIRGFLRRRVRGAGAQGQRLRPEIVAIAHLPA
jgi:hypothetical protein